MKAMARLGMKASDLKAKTTSQILKEYNGRLHEDDLKYTVKHEEHRRKERIAMLQAVPSPP